MKTDPESPVSSAAQQCISVDLPEPLGPITAVNSPAARSRETSSSAVTSAAPAPYVLVRCRTRAAGITVCEPSARVDWVMDPRSRVPPNHHHGFVALASPARPRLDPETPTRCGRTRVRRSGLCSVPWTSREPSSRRPRRACAPSPAWSAGPLTRGAWVDVQRDLDPRRRRRLRRARRRGPVAGRAPADVRPRGRRAAPGAHLRGRGAAAAPGARARPGTRCRRTTSPSSASRS